MNCVARKELAAAEGTVNCVKLEKVKGWRRDVCCPLVSLLLLIFSFFRCCSLLLFPPPPFPVFVYFVFSFCCFCLFFLVFCAPHTFVTWKKCQRSHSHRPFSFQMHAHTLWIVSSTPIDLDRSAYAGRHFVNRMYTQTALSYFVLQPILDSWTAFQRQRIPPLWYVASANTTFDLPFS